MSSPGQGPTLGDEPADVGIEFGEGLLDPGPHLGVGDGEEGEAEGLGPLAEDRAVGLGHVEQVGDDGEGQTVAEVALDVETTGCDGGAQDLLRPARISGRRAFTARGVKAQLTSERIRVCAGGFSRTSPAATTPTPGPRWCRSWRTGRRPRSGGP